MSQPHRVEPGLVGNAAMQADRSVGWARSQSTGTPARMALQQRAPATIRRHVQRSIARTAVLLAGDFLAFLGAREVLRLVRDHAVLGRQIARAVEWGIPRGSFAGWQLVSALGLGLAIAGAYRRGDYRRDPRLILAGVTVGAGLTLWSELWVRSVPRVMVQYAATVAGLWMMVVLARRLIDYGVSRYWMRRRAAERVLFVGDPSDGAAVTVCARLSRAESMETIGWVTPREHVNGGADGAAALGTVDEFWDILHGTPVETVVLCGNMPDKAFDMVVEASAAAGCRLLSVSRYDGVGRLRPSLVWYHRVPLVELTVPALRGQQLMLKRIIDVVVASMALVILAPVFVILAVAIKFDSRGSVVFSQERVGMGGRPFRLLKFRTMRDGADDEKASVAHLNRSGDPRLFKIPNDPRVTPLGRWLRRWSVDELPQLWNVLKGEMSLVGPRPFFESDLGGYDDHHFGRLGAKPGITGLWQVRGRSDVLDFEEVVRLDREYIDRWSLWLDLKVFLLTVPAVLRRSGAF